MSLYNRLTETGLQNQQQKKLFFCAAILDHFQKNVQMLDHFFPLLFPKDSESLKILDIPLREVGAKRPLNGTSKVNTHTDTQTDRRTDRQTDKSTYRLNRPRGPIQWKSLIRETKHLSTNADSITDAKGGWTKAKSAKTNTFFCAVILDHVQTKMFKC